MKLRKLTMAEVEFRVECEPDETPVRGNALASGDDAADRACEDGILRRLEAGDTWAWCTVKVSATWRGIFVNEYLGCCSYESEADFRDDEGIGYFTDMKRAALDSLNEKLARAFADVEPLIEVT